MRPRLPALLLFTSALWATACAGPREVAPPPADGEAAAPTYETFDPSAYEAPPARPAATVEHDVPPRLMEGRVELPRQEAPATPQAPQPRTVQGFRVQVFSGEDRSSAERVRAEADAWGQNRAMEASVVYIQPYYRVRLGASATRADAEAALANVRSRFPEAFLVPDLVTVYE